MNKKMTAAGIFILVVFFLSGCHQQVIPSSGAFIGSGRTFEKNYELDQKLVAYVGKPIVKVKDYTVNRFQDKHMRASDDFVISGGIITILGNKNTDYVVRGETTIDDKTYTVLDLPGGKRGAGFGALINPDGSVHSKLLNDNIIMIYTFSSSPTNLRFTSSKMEKIDRTSGYLNYELIYGGTDGKSITITYREYTNEDLARPAFYQNAVYEAGAKQIRYKDTVIQVYSATNEKIVFKVVSDGLSN